MTDIELLNEGIKKLREAYKCFMKIKELDTREISKNITHLMGDAIALMLDEEEKDFVCTHKDIDTIY